jgi:hypothetical protein
MSVRSLLLAVLALLALAAPAGALVKLPEILPPVAGNPADRLVAQPIEDSYYEPARNCRKGKRPGTDALTDWLERNVRGEFWGSYRCEKWGKGSASLHAENRAIDWHLDAARAADRREAERFITLILAPDAVGNAQALARRMGVEEVIWDCGYWSAGMTEFSRSSVCYSKRGKLRKRFDKTAAHRDHLHIGMTRDGAMGRTSFWAR